VLLPPHLLILPKAWSLLVFWQVLALGTKRIHTHIHHVHCVGLSDVHEASQCVVAFFLASGTAISWKLPTVKSTSKQPALWTPDIYTCNLMKKVHITTFWLRYLWAVLAGHHLVAWAGRWMSVRLKSGWSALVVAAESLSAVHHCPRHESCYALELNYILTSQILGHKFVPVDLKFGKPLEMIYSCFFNLGAVSYD
jgi:hypothetical protein